MSERNRKFRVAVRQFEPFSLAMEHAWASFCAAEGIDGIELEAVSLDLHPLYDSLVTQQGASHGDWDIAFCPTDWLAALHADNLLLDLAPYIAQAPPQDYPDGWAPSLLQMQVFGDAVLGLPYHDGPECLIYRTDLFNDPVHRQAFRREYGRSLTVPRTWDDFVDTARYFHNPEAGLYGTVLAGYPDAHNTIYDFHLQVWTRGGSVLTDEGAVQLDTPEAVAALNFYRDLMQDDSLIHPQSRKLDSVASGLEFAHGRIAMMVNWFGFASMCETIPESAVKGNVAITTLPSATGNESTSLNIYWVLAIPTGCPNADLAYRFMRYCASPAEDKNLTLGGGIGCRRSTWLDADVNRQIPFYRDMESLHAVARELPRLPNWPQVTEVIDELMLAVVNTNEPVASLTGRFQDQLASLDR
ncbi:MAG: sugar ABC transporter substrate-binding protein [Caldilineaceae bacterium SB0666_bin_21]|nr:sugar ABC transporter substrate-binding protein [Caldilineaceae bacterium SB0666_bin_21]